MRPVYEADSLVQAQLLVDLLEEAGIETVVRNAHLQGLFGELPMNQRPVVCVVENEQWAYAVVLAGEFVQAQLLPPGPPWTCKSCGETSPSNFGECWQCRAPAPA